MNITFMVGNGFDLNLGLHTTFKDFVQMFSKENESDSKVVKIFKNYMNQDLEQWSNAEIAFGECTEKFDGVTLTVDDFCDCHEHFCEELSKYLEAEEAYVELEDPEIGKVFAKAIFNLTRGFRERQRDEIHEYIESIGDGFRYNFISFNYTRTLDQCAKFAKEFLGSRRCGGMIYANTIEPIRHIHGYTDKDMILGVNDESQVKNLFLFENQAPEYLDEIIKIQTNRANEENNDEKACNILRESDLIYVYGMSIGATDAIWWDRVCKLLHEKKNLHLIVHAFDAPTEGIIRRKFITFEKERKHQITEFSSLGETEKENIESRIHITGQNIFSELKDIAISHSQVGKNQTEEEAFDAIF